VCPCGNLQHLRLRVEYSPLPGSLLCFTLLCFALRVQTCGCVRVHACAPPKADPWEDVRPFKLTATSWAHDKKKGESVKAATEPGWGAGLGYLVSVKEPVGEAK